MKSRLNMKMGVMFALVIAVLCFGKQICSAATTDTRINLNTECNGTLSGKDYNLYSFEITDSNQGYINISFSANALYDLRNGYDIYLYDSKYNEIASDTYVYQGDLINYATLSPGIYYLKIAPNRASYEDLSGVPYTFEVKFVTSDTWEKEDNGTADTANTIEAGKEYSGSCLNFDDYDVYELKVTGYKKVSIELVLDNIKFSYGNGFETEIFNKKMESLYDKKWIDSSVKSDTLILAPGTYYFRIRVTQEFGNKPYNTPYSFAVSSKSYNVNVKFNSCGGSSVKTLSVVAGNKVKTLNSPTRKGYAFIGWYTKKSGGTKVTASTTIKSSTTLYAHWNKK